LKYGLRGCEIAFALSRGGYEYVVSRVEQPGSHFA